MSVILAIESSCDDTSVAVAINGKIKSNVIANQTIHEKFGGVIPEAASRMHQVNIVPAAQQAIAQAGITMPQLSAVAFTQGPGLLGSLLVGAGFAKSFALGRGLPLIAVNHMRAHILAHFIQQPAPAFPFICLTVSGGHTQIVLVHSYFNMQLIGHTIDDAAGEAFDKTAKLLGLPYPGGPLIDKYAQQGNPLAYTFPQPKIPGFNYSFSGFKTAVLYFLRAQLQANPQFISQNLADICASVQHSIISILLHKLQLAAAHYGVTRIAIAGGVSANSGLRAALLQRQANLGWQVFIPPFQYCTDNAGMVAMAAHLKYQAGMFSSQSAVPMPRMPFTLP